MQCLENNLKFVIFYYFYACVVFFKSLNSYFVGSSSCHGFKVKNRFYRNVLQR
jgi:hypothetical protein